jgi:hypothetical protein
LRAAGDIKNAEQQIARANFEAERQKAFDALCGAFERAGHARLSSARRLVIENGLDHLVTLFNMKEFASVRRESGRILGASEAHPSRPRPTQRMPDRGREPAPTLSELFRRGLALERAERTREAVEIYGRIIARDPNHSQAIGRLKQIGSRSAGRTENRRVTCTDRYMRRGR